MLRKSNENVIEASQFVEMIGDAKLKNHKLFKSRKGKVNYLVTESNTHLFDNLKYAKIFEQLSICEDKLVEPLEFEVQISFITLEAIYNFYNDAEIENLVNELSTGIFMLINDLSHSYLNMSSEELADKYLYSKTLEKLKKFYTEYYEEVIECFKNYQSSIPLFEIVYEAKTPAVMSKFCELIRNENTHQVTKRIACAMICEFANTAPTLISSKEKEEYYYQMSFANSHVGLLEKYIWENDSYNHTIESYYNYLKETL